MSELLSDLRVTFCREAVIRVFVKVRENDLFGLAGQLAYSFLISFFPFLIFIVSLAGLALSDPQAAVERLINRTSGFLPEEATALLANYVSRTLQHTGTGLLVGGILGTLWLGSGAAIAITKAANRAYNLTENRPFWKLRGTAVLIALGFTVMMTVLTLVVFKVLVYAQGASGSHVLLRYWNVGRWLLAFVVVTLALDVVYYLAPNAHMRYRWVTPGGLLATVLMFFMSGALSFYVADLGNYNRIYGQIGTVVVLMVWLYLTGLAVLVGIEVNAITTRLKEERQEVRLIHPRHPKDL
ncbi:YihY/virulence factor BrkB family protein [Rubrobacter calidifluminis]|uniref:YihY/virulence factor BrkB family protein n=1 Tax=Rubrobacter calidifluminis TaxID=1392640 RepID=UPI00236017E0|nr:YihY/virulence factor BrkB family protein [Rubrobacter calidifluminis]